MDLKLRNELKKKYILNGNSIISLDRRIRPKKLYIYKKMEKVTRDFNLYLERGRAWFSAINRFNDPFEGILCTNLTKSLLEIRPPEKSYEEALKDIGKYDVQMLEAKLLKTYNDYKEKICVACLSETFDNILMWSYYTDHKGVCIEYDFNALIAQFREILFPIVYAKRYNMLDEILKERVSDWAFCEGVTTKAEMWSHENEWRIILKNEYISDFNGAGGSFPMPTPTAVYLGARIKENKELYDKMMEYSAIHKNCYQIRLDAEEYKLIANKI